MLDAGGNIRIQQILEDDAVLVKSADPLAVRVKLRMGQILLEDDDIGIGNGLSSERVDQGGQALAKVWSLEDRDGSSGGEVDGDNENGVLDEHYGWLTTVKKI